VLIGWLVLIGVFLWFYSPVFARLFRYWCSPDYQHGFFVPVFAAVLLWRRREMVDPLPDHGSWWAMAFFAVWALMWGISAFLSIERVGEWSILPFAAGVAVFLGSWRALRWAWPSIAFLFFMTPLPGAVEGRLGPFLQTIGTKASVYAIQVLGIPAVPVGVDGNVIQLPETQLEVVDACSGIKMLVLFFAICVGAAFWLRCSLWKKAVIVVSAIPIAVFSNVARITMTAVLHELVRKFPALFSENTQEVLFEFFHDFAGLFMMPLALVLLLALWKLMEKLFIDQAPEGPLALAGGFGGKPSAAGSRSTDSVQRHT
jgi:exosortase